MSLERHRRFIEDVEASPEYWHELAVAEFTDDLTRLLEEKQVSRAELARRLGTSRAYITKLLGGDANFTLMTMVKLALALESAVHVHLADRRAQCRWVDEVQAKGKPKKEGLPPAKVPQAKRSHPQPPASRR